MISRSRFIALSVLGAVVSLACIATGVFLALSTVKVTRPEVIAQQPEQINGTLQGYYTQSMRWRPCKPEEITSRDMPAPKNLSPYECAEVQAPLDWDNPAGDAISLAVAVHRSGKENAPVLFYNLGGPGGGAVDALVSQVRDSLGDALVDAYDIVAVDPRGVGSSTPVQCLNDHELDNFNAYGVITDSEVEAAKERAFAGEKETPEEEVRHAQRLMEQFGQGCQKLTGDLAGHIDTVSVARDFDMVRQILGQEKFNYLGYSYGTFLGATYADLFPTTVNRMVLDAAVDPAMNAHEISALQMKGFDESLIHWIENCQSGAGCPLPGDTRAGIARVNAFLSALKSHPLETSDPNRPLTQPLALNAMIGLMYFGDGYELLTQAMSQALTQKDGSMLLRIADFLADRKEDGTYGSNAGQALIAVNSLDYPAVGAEKDWIPQVMQLRSELQILSEFVGYDAAGLAVWPFKSQAVRRPLTAQGAPPIIVIGQTHDPATPYVMSQNLAGQLHSGVLVTQEGWTHGAYSKTAGRCVVDAVENYFLDGVVPQAGLVCE